MRFLADMGIAQRAVEWLRSQGHDAVHLRELGLQRLEDDAIFREAVEGRRVILTFDLDFSEIAAHATGATISVIVFRLHNTTTPFLIRRLDAVLRTCAAPLATGAVVSVEDARQRVRALPIGRGEDPPPIP